MPTVSVTTPIMRKVIKLPHYDCTAFYKESIDSYVVWHPSEPEPTVEVINIILNLAKGLKRTIAILDWTDQYIESEASWCINQGMFVVFRPNVRKLYEEVDYQPCKIHIGEREFKMVNAILQYDRYKDDWHFLPKTGLKLQEDKGFCYAQLTKNILQLNCPLIARIGHEGDAEWYGNYETKLFASLLAKKIIEVYPDLENLQFQINIKKQIEDYQRFLGKGNAITKQTLKDKILNLQRDMQSHYQSLVQKEREVQSTTTLLRSMERREGLIKAQYPPEKLEEIFRNLIKKEKFKTIDFMEDGIYATTDNMVIESHDRNFSVGEFSIQIRLNGVIRIRNMTRRFDNTYDHPHVSNESPCLGNYKNTLPKMIFEGDYFGVLTVLLDFLKTVNPEGTYIPLEKAWGTAEDWCEDCDKPWWACSCDICSRCGESTENCECERCPISGHLMEDVNCDDCDQYYSDDDDNEEDARCHY